MRGLVYGLMGACAGCALGVWLGCEWAWQGPPRVAPQQAATVVWQTDTVRATDTVRLPPDTVWIAPAGGDTCTVRIDERDDGRLWLRIADTLRGVQWGGRRVDYVWQGPVAVHSVRIDLAAPGFQGLRALGVARPPRGAWGLGAGAGVSGWPGGAWVGVGIGLRRGPWWVGVRGGRAWDRAGGGWGGGLWVAREW